MTKERCEKLKEKSSDLNICPRIADKLPGLYVP